MRRNLANKFCYNLASLWHLWEYWRAPKLPSISHLAWALITPHWLPVWKTGFTTQWHPYTSLPASYDLGSHGCGYGYPPPCASLMLLAYFKLSLSLDVITIKQKKKYPYWLANPPPLLWVSEYLREPRLAPNSWSSCSQLLGFELFLFTMCPQWLQTEQKNLFYLQLTEKEEYAVAVQLWKAAFYTISGGKRLSCEASATVCGSGLRIRGWSWRSLLGRLTL